MLFENNNNYFDLMNVYPIINDKFSNETSGFYKGNMFDNEYVPYKNYKESKYIPKDNEEKLLLEIMELSFAINDYNLYLDLHENDREIFRKYQESKEKLESLTKKYENMYGPLQVDCGSYDTFKWLETPWPWDKENVKYV